MLLLLNEQSMVVGLIIIKIINVYTFSCLSNWGMLSSGYQPFLFSNIFTARTSHIFLFLFHRGTNIFTTYSPRVPGVLLLSSGCYAWDTRRKEHCHTLKRTILFLSIGLCLVRSPDESSGNFKILVQPSL